MKGFLRKFFDTQIAAQFSRFFVVGLLAFSVDAIILQVLVSFADWGVYWARVPSALSAVAVSWMLNRSYTFKSAKEHSILRPVITHISATGIGLAVNLVVYWGSITLIPVLKANPVMALAMGSAVGLFINFLLAKYWVFRHNG